MTFFTLNLGDAPGSVPQPKISFPPCTSDCDANCVDMCPDYCCVKGLKSEANRKTQPAKEVIPFRELSAVSYQPQASLYCPETCSSFCSISCPTECCENKLKEWTRMISPHKSTRQCLANCNSRSCSADCPSRCCQGEKAPQIPVQLEKVKAPLLLSLGLVCPTLCHKSCLEQCPEHCCSKKNKKQNHTVQHRKNIIHGNSV